MPPTGWTTSRDVTYPVTDTPVPYEGNPATDIFTTFWAVTNKEDELLTFTTADLLGGLPDIVPTDMVKDGDPAISTTTILFASLAVVFSCFALTAIFLRIGSRLKKSKMQALEKRRHQQRMSANNIKEEPKPQLAHKRLTIRMHAGQDKKRKASKTTTFALNGSASKESDQKKTRKASVKRNRTVEALIEIGAFSKDFVLPESDANGQQIAMEPIKTRTASDANSVTTVVSGKESNVSSKGAAYTNKAFDQKNPDKIHSVYFNNLLDGNSENRYSTLDTANLVLRTKTGDNSPSFGGGERVTSDKSRSIYGEELSDGSSHAKEDDSMLEARRYSTASSRDSECSPPSTRRTRPTQFLKAFDKNRNNSRDSGYVESVASQESIKKRKLGIVEPFHHRIYLEENYSPTKNSENNQINRCPTCQTPTPQKQFYNRYLNTMVVNEVPIKMAPFRKCVSVPFRSPSDRSPFYGNLGQASFLTPTYAPQSTCARSYSVIGDDAAYNMKYSLMPSHHFFRKRNSETQTEGAPLHRKSTVRWKKEGGNYILTPLENNEIDHLGPIYLTPES